MTLPWTRTYLKQLGFIENSARGIWTLTDKEYKESSVSCPCPDVILPPPDWRETINNYLVETLTPAAFERLIQRTLRETGFVQVEVTGKTGDGEIDGKGIAKINGILSFREIIPAK